MSDTNDTDDLDRLREEIDRLDTRIHDALMRRTEIVEKVAIAKRAASGSLGTALRPDREALMAQRIAAAHSGAFPLRSAQRIWREIVGALTQMQLPFTVHLGSTGASEMDAVRYAFGTATPIMQHTNGATALAASRGAASDLAALPLDGEEWAALTGEEGVLMRSGDMLIVGPRLDIPWDVPLFVSDSPVGVTLARAGAASLHTKASSAARPIGGYMDGPWLPDAPDRRS